MDGIESFVLLDRMVMHCVTALALVVGCIYFLKLVEAWLLHRSFREALQRDAAVAGALLERMDRGDAREEQRGDDRTGLLLIAIGLALVGFTLVVGDERWSRYGVGSALFPIFAGAVLLVRHVWLRRLAGRGGAEGA